MKWETWERIRDKSSDELSKMSFHDEACPSCGKSDYHLYYPFVPGCEQCNICFKPF